MKMERTEAIQKLFDLQEICVGQTTFFTHDDITAIRMGMVSLKADEAYQLEYENIRVYTRDEVLNMLKDIKYSDDVLKALDDNIKILRFVQDKEQTDGNDDC